MEEAREIADGLSEGDKIALRNSSDGAFSNCPVRLVELKLVSAGTTWRQGATQATAVFFSTDLGRQVAALLE